MIYTFETLTQHILNNNMSEFYSLMKLRDEALTKAVQADPNSDEYTKQWSNVEMADRYLASWAESTVGQTVRTTMMNAGNLLSTWS